MTATIRAAEGLARGVGAREGVRRLVTSGALLALLALLAPASAEAELVILVNGSFLRVNSFEVQPDEDRIRLDLLSGGVMVLPLGRVSRILDDEISKEPPPEEPDGFVLRYREGQAVPEGPYGELIYRAAITHGLNPALVSAVALAESSYDPGAVSVKGAQGLMQLMPATAERFGLDGNQVFEPALNLDAGSRYLRWLADRFDDDLTRVLAAYNAGEGTVDRYDGVPPYRETRGYLRRIFGRLGLDPPELDSP